MKSSSQQHMVVFISKAVHKNAVVLVLSFRYNELIINALRNINTTCQPQKRYTFSRSLKAWISPFSKENLAEIRRVLAPLAQLTLDASLFNSTVHRGVKPPRNLTEANTAVIENYAHYLQGKRYSKSTVQTYVSFMADFVDYIQPTPLEGLTNRDVELFLEQVFVGRNYSISSQRQFISALKLFVAFYPACAIEAPLLERPKASKILPTVLSQEEVIRLLQVTKNLKHRTILALLYSAGLRIGELINLELKHIDVLRRQVFIHHGKGRKDRYVILAESFVPLLQNYLLTYTPKRYFVEGQPGQRYSDSSVRKFLHLSTRQAGIVKRVTPHTLRHSYATHLLENGIGLRHIQELLGHAKPETTMIYTHVVKKDLLNIKSPLDTILASFTKQQEQRQLPTERFGLEDY